MVTDSQLPPYSQEAERGVLGCCLLDLDKMAVALKAGASRRWFYELRHIELFNLLSGMHLNGGGDIVTAAITLKEQGKLESIGGPAYLAELQNAVPSASNVEYYLEILRDYHFRRLVLDVSARLKLAAEDTRSDPAVGLADAENVVSALRRIGDPAALPDIVAARDLLATDLPDPPELIQGILHQGSKLILGGASKTFKTWTLLDLAVSVATGTPWLGFPTARGKVLYVNLEIQPPFFRRRIAKVVEAKQVELDANLEIWNLRGCIADYRVLIPKIRSQLRDQGHSLLILDPTYKLLGDADENSATDIGALLQATETLATTTGAAIAMATHFAKGNPAGKDSIDRISGSGVFARDPDSLITFTRHEEDGAFVVESTLRNFPPVEPFVVKWDYPLFKRTDQLDPTKLRQIGGRPAKYSEVELLECLGDRGLTSTQWQERCAAECGIPRRRFYELKKVLETGKKTFQSTLDEKWHRISDECGNSKPYKDE